MLQFLANSYRSLILSLRNSLRVIYLVGQVILLATVLIAFYLIAQSIYIDPIEQSTGQPIKSYTYTMNIINLVIVVIGIVSAISQHNSTLKGVSSIKFNL